LGQAAWIGRVEMERSGKSRPRLPGMETKKCPNCYVYLQADADRCHSCGSRVGKRDKTGFAAKPVNWKAYTVSVLAWAAFGLYIWWVFFKE
jgi:hypothetical protein